jgi:hypothetical protein
MDLPASMWTVGCHSCHRLHEEVRALNKEIARLKELMKRGPIATVFDDVTGKATLLYELPK